MRRRADPLENLPRIDADGSLELGFAAETWQRIVEAAPGPLHRLTLEGIIATEASVDIGRRRPDPDDPTNDFYSLEVAVTVVPRKKAYKIAEELRNLLGEEAQCLVATRGAKDFVYIYETSYRRAASMGKGIELLVLFPGSSFEPLLWARQTNAANYDMGPKEILGELRRLDSSYGLQVEGAGWDWVQIKTLRLPEDTFALATELVDFCYDLAAELVPYGDEWGDPEPLTLAPVEEGADWDEPLDDAILAGIEGMLSLSEFSDAYYEGTTASTAPLTPADFKGSTEILQGLLDRLEKAPNGPDEFKAFTDFVGLHKGTIIPHRLVAALGKEAFDWMFEGAEVQPAQLDPDDSSDRDEEEDSEDYEDDEDGEDEDDDEDLYERRAAEILAEKLKNEPTVVLYWS